MKHLEKAIDYVRGNVDMEEVEFTISRIYDRHSSLECENKSLYDLIYDLLEEYGEDYDLPEEWWWLMYECEIEDIFLEL